MDKKILEKFSFRSNFFLDIKLFFRNISNYVYNLKQRSDAGDSTAQILCYGLGMVIIVEPLSLIHYFAIYFC